MAKVLQVNGVTVPSVADAWVEKDVSGISLGSGTGVYLSIEYRWPATTQAAWVFDGWIPAFFGIGDPTNPLEYAGPNFDFNYPGGDWEMDNFYLIQAGHFTSDVWHTLDVHIHDLTGDARVDGGTLATDVTGPSVAAETGNGGVSTPFGTTTVQKRASPFTVADSAILDLAHILIYQKNGSPSDNVVVQVCADSGGAPGTVLDTTSQAFSAGPNFVFTGGVTLTAGTTYWLVISRAGAPDNVNNYTAGNDQTSGNPLNWNGSSWVAGQGVSFRLYTQFIRFDFGEFFTDPVDNTLLIREISIGTGGFGTHDVFHETWAGGSPLSDFDAHSGDLVVIPEPGAAPFSLSATPVGISIGIPGSGHSTIISTMITGPPEPITLSITTSLPTGVTGVFATNPISDDSGTSVLTLSADNTASPGTTTVTVQGDDGAGGTATTDITLYISDAPPGFHIAS